MARREPCTFAVSEQDCADGLGHDGQGRALQATRRTCGVNEITPDIVALFRSRAALNSRLRPSISFVSSTCDCAYSDFTAGFSAAACLEKSALCKNDLCTICLTHIKCGSTLCILYVRNGGRYGGLRIRAGKHRWPILGRPISRAKSSEMREDISGKN